MEPEQQGRAGSKAGGRKGCEVHRERFLDECLRSLSEQSRCSDSEHSPSYTGIEQSVPLARHISEFTSVRLIDPRDSQAVQ